MKSNQPALIIIKYDCLNTSVEISSVRTSQVRNFPSRTFMLKDTERDSKRKFFFPTNLRFVITNEQHIVLKGRKLAVQFWLLINEGFAIPQYDLFSHLKICLLNLLHATYMSIILLLCLSACYYYYCSNYYKLFRCHIAFSTIWLIQCLDELLRRIYALYSTGTGTYKNNTKKYAAAKNVCKNLSNSLPGFTMILPHYLGIEETFF